MTTISLGQFLPASLSDLKKRAKRVAAVLDVPLMKAQQGLAELYGFSSFVEASRRVQDGHPHASFSDLVLPQHQAAGVRPSWELVAARDHAAVAMACRLTGDSLPGPREVAVASLGLFDSEPVHGGLFHVLRPALDQLGPMHDAVRLLPHAPLSMYATPTGLTLESNPLLLAIQTAMSIDDEIALHRLHALALLAPQTPWPAAAALIRAAQDGGLTWVPTYGLMPATVRAWSLRKLAAGALKGYLQLRPAELSEPDETDASSFLRDEAMAVAGQVFSLLGQHHKALDALNLVRSDRVSTAPRIALQTLRRISLVHVGLPFGGRNLSRNRGNPNAFESAFLAALGEYRAESVGGRSVRSSADIAFARALAATPHLMRALSPDWESPHAADAAGHGADYVQEVLERASSAVLAIDGLDAHLTHIVQDAGVRHAWARLHAPGGSDYPSALGALERAVLAAADLYPRAPGARRRSHGATIDTTELDRRILAGRAMQCAGTEPFFNIVHNMEMEMEATGWLLEQLQMKRPPDVPVFRIHGYGRDMFERLYDTLRHPGVTDFMRARMALHAAGHFLHGDAQYMGEAAAGWDELEFDEDTFEQI